MIHPRPNPPPPPINDIDTATDPFTIADDVAIMFDEDEFQPAAVKPVFGNLLLCGGVVSPCNTKDSLEMLSTSNDLPDSKPKWVKSTKQPSTISSKTIA
jgi:hypothetical protein